MANTTATPTHLASIIFNKLKSENNSSKISIKTLEVLCETLFYTSLKTEEGQLINLNISFFDSPDFEQIRSRKDSAEHWMYVPFEKSVIFNSRYISKLAKAVDPWSSSLAVNDDMQGNLVISGLVDQAVHYQSFLNFETAQRPEQPGLFHISIIGIGSLMVVYQYQLLATLKHDILADRNVDIFNFGQINKMIIGFNELKQADINSYIEKNNLVLSHPYEKRMHELWIETLSRILIRIQNYRHGGALLIPASTEAIDIKYKITYDRINSAISSLIKHEMRLESLENNIFFDYGLDGNMPVTSYRKANTLSAKKKGIENELKGALRFTASLTCVDGTVILDRNLKVLGFGCVLNAEKKPRFVYVPKFATVKATSEVSPVKFDHFGTRHQSMFSYCWTYPGSLGFVVSQDGDIRAITRIGNRLIMWESIKVHRMTRPKSANKGIIPNYEIF